MSGRYGKGYKPSPPDKIGKGHPFGLLSAMAIPDTIDIELPPAVDQGGSQSCTGNASAVAICEAMRTDKSEPFPELPSRLFLYFNARASVGDQGDDGGAYVHAIFEEAAVLGYPPESAWTFSDQFARVTERPQWAAYRAAADQRMDLNLEAYRLSSVGRARCDAVDRALASGYTVVFGTDVDEAFEALGALDVWPGIRGEVLGGHCMVIHRRRIRPTRRQYALRSSWRASFADHGSAWVDEDAIASPHASDLWIVRVAKKYSVGT